MIYPLNINEIEKALSHTKIIKWNERFFISSASPVVEECMRRLEKSLGIKLRTGENKALKHFLDRSSKQFEISNNPPDTYVAELKPGHLHIVDKTWTFHSEKSYRFFQSLLENHLIYALYSTKDDSPVAWVTISWKGTLTHLYTIEEHRRKGYAEHILKVAVNDQLSKGKDVLGHTLENNLKAQKLFDKLSFERTGFDMWLFIEKE
nr:glycine N-acyltransferase-like protein 3 [Maniola hyperantus]